MRRLLPLLVLVLCLSVFARPAHASAILYGANGSGGALSTLFTNLVTVNIATGAVTTIGATVAGLDALAFAPVANPTVPEPASILLLGSGAALAARFRRRQK
jgi:hypothetical protein